MSRPGSPTIASPSSAMDVAESPSAAPRKRKRNVESTGDSRRLRRSHEACSRCRAKKIKCDSKHPRCSACANSGVVCAQEDRHRNTLTPRGHLERVEFQLAQAIILIRHLTGRPHFDLFDLDSGLVDAGLDPNPPPLNSFTYEPLMNMYTTAFPPPEYYAHINTRPPAYSTRSSSEPTSPRTNELRGQDPNSNDLSNTQALAKNFGVSADIVSVIAANHVDREDLAVGSSGLSSGRDRSLHEAATPRDPAHWVTVTVSNAFANPPHIETVIPDLSGSMDVWLPKDRSMVEAIVDVYFTRLNIHRPVFSRRGFAKSLDELYAGQVSASGENNTPHDPGFLCSFYLVLALGTLSDLNNRSVHHQMDYTPTQQLLVKKLMPPDWPEHDEFFERALSVKPDLRVTMSSLQALILLHWYLYTERQGRTLWRLVGSLVRLSVELGLHHDPTTQVNASKQRVFTEEESLLRIHLWGIILIHDRGTSILLGRPLGIAPSDSNTPRPSRAKGHNGFSEHFELSHAVAEIQADIINSLYSPTRQKGDALMRNATRVLKSMSEFRRSLPERYQNYFGGTEDWTMEQKTKLVREIKEDEGLTLLKIGIARLLLLRALFSSTELHYEHRHKALIDAIVTAHNVIIFHSQLIRFP
ncbi:fungal-specific transcription factor domain-containing protein [Mycena amicta]|nr:fungal-specific transcription factor domain-containing protein [Mycena amicta]